MKWMSVIHPFSWWLPSRVFQETLQHDSLRVGWWILIRRAFERNAIARTTHDRKKNNSASNHRDLQAELVKSCQSTAWFFEDLRMEGEHRSAPKFLLCKDFFSYTWSRYYTPESGIHLNQVLGVARSSWSQIIAGEKPRRRAGWQNIGRNSIKKSRQCTVSALVFFGVTGRKLLRPWNFIRVVPTEIWFSLYFWLVTCRHQILFVSFLFILEGESSPSFCLLVCYTTLQSLDYSMMSWIINIYIYKF